MTLFLCHKGVTVTDQDCIFLGTETVLDLPYPDVKVPKGICVNITGSNHIYANAAASLDEVRKAANSWKGTDEERREKLEMACST